MAYTKKAVLYRPVARQQADLLRDGGWLKSAHLGEPEMSILVEKQSRTSLLHVPSLHLG